MSKSEGRNIVIKFTNDITTEDIGANKSAFKVSGKEYKYVNGPLLDKEYVIDKVERFGVVPIWNLGESYCLSSEGEGYVLEKHDTNSTDTYGPSMIKGNVVKFKENIVLAGISLKTIASGTHTVNIKSAYNGATITSASANGDTRGEWIDIILNAPLEIIVANKSDYYIEIVHPTGSSYATNSPRYNGTLWESEGAYFGTWYGSNYTFAMGVIFEESAGFTEYDQLITNAVQIAGAFKVRWLEDKPVNTAITIEYTTGTEQGEWVELSNGDVVTSDTNLWFRITLETTDTSVTPTLQDLWIEEPDAPQDKIRIVMDEFSRFPTVHGDLTVEYDATIGNLVGQGGAVESFTREFLPAELIATPNPNAEENISVAPVEVIAELKDIEFPKGYSEHGNITVAPIEVTAVLLDVEDINP